MVTSIQYRLLGSMNCPYAWCAWNILQSAYRLTKGINQNGTIWSVVFETLFTRTQDAGGFTLEFLKADNSKLEDLRAIARFANKNLSNNKLVPSEPHSQINAWSTFEFAFQELLSKPSKIHSLDDATIKYYQSVPILAAIISSIDSVNVVEEKFCKGSYKN